MGKNQISEMRIEGNEKKNIKLTFDMLQGMIEALADMDTTATYAHAKPARHTTATPIKTVKKGTLNAEYIRTWGTDAQQALPLEYLEAPETQLDIDYMRQKWINAKTHNARAFWTSVGRFAVALNEIKTKQDLLDVTLPEDDFLADYCRKLIKQRMAQLPGEHQLICNPDFSNLEGMEAISQHLGEKPQPKPHLVKGQKGRFLSGATGLSNLEKQIYYEAQFTAQAEPVMPHEDRSKQAWYLYAGGVKKQFNCTTEEAEKLFNAFQTIGINKKLAKEFQAWIEGTSIKDAVEYFSRLAADLAAVSAENDGKIIDIYTLDEETNKAIDADHPADIADIKAVAYHKLDDPRDFAPTWESRQPEEFRNQIARIRDAKTFGEVKAVGGSFFNDRNTKAIVDSFTKTQRTVLWDVYNRRKHNLMPKLRPLALKALERMTDKKVDLSKVAAWLHGEGKQRLNAHELSVVWNAWKKAKKAYAPKQTVMTNWSWWEADKEAARRLQENIKLSAMTEAEINGTYEQYEDMLFTIPE